jgi:hypothetical protein
MTSQLSLVKKTSMFLDKMIHITHKCAIHLHGHLNKMVPLIKHFILMDLSNDAKCI